MKLEHNQNPQSTFVKSNKKSKTSILCELTRLKSQQKYLECNQVKLNAANFMDEDPKEPSAKVSSVSQSNQSTLSTINEIDHLRLQFEENLHNYRENAIREIRDMWLSINNMKSDVFQEERLKQFSVQTIRERIINVNTQLEKLNSKNRGDMAGLQIECARLETETNKFIFN